MINMADDSKAKEMGSESESKQVKKRKSKKNKKGKRKEFLRTHEWAAYITPELYREYASHMSDYPIISVGSGSGYVEHTLGCDDRIICIDPQPKWYGNQDVVLEPKYPFVRDLIMDRPEIVGECHLMLVWPTPGNVTYDIRAIRDLKPRMVTIIYDSSGSAGGSPLIAWLYAMGGPLPCQFRRRSLVPEYQAEFVDGYKIHHSYSCMCDDGGSLFSCEEYNYSIVLLRREDHKVETECKCSYKSVVDDKRAACLRLQTFKTKIDKEVFRNKTDAQIPLFREHEVLMEDDQLGSNSYAEMVNKLEMDAARELCKSMVTRK
jgi:hypothetical protein